MALSCTFTETNEVFLFSQDFSASSVLLVPDYTLPLSGAQSSSETVSIAAAEELSYRQSRLYRLLGNPVAFRSGRAVPMVPKVSGVPVVQSLRSSLDRAFPIVPDVPPLRSAQAGKLNSSRSTFNSSIVQRKTGTSTFLEFPKRRNETPRQV